VNRRLVVLGVTAAAVVGVVAPSFAQSFPIGVQTSTDNGVSVGFTVNGEPGGGAAVRNGQACAGLGEDIPFCTPPVTIVSPRTRQSLPITVRRDSNGTTVAVGVVGVYVSNGGRVCPLVSTQTWQCIGVE